MTTRNILGVNVVLDETIINLVKADYELKRAIDTLTETKEFKLPPTLYSLLTSLDDEVSDYVLETINRHYYEFTRADAREGKQLTAIEILLHGYGHEIGLWADDPEEDESVDGPPSGRA